MKQPQFFDHQRHINPLPRKILLSLVAVLALVVLIWATRPAALIVWAATATGSSRTSPRPTASPRPTPSPRPTATPIPNPSPSQEVATENLKDRIDRILETRQEKLEELQQAGQRRRVFIGEVQRVTERTVTIKTARGNQSFTVGQDVALAKNGRTATIDDIAVGDWVGVIGFAEKETIQPQVVVISPRSLRPTPRQTVIGTIKEVSRTQLVITEPSQNERTFQLGRNTKYEGNDGTVIRRENLQTETQVIVILPDPDSTNTASVVRSLAGRR